MELTHLSMVILGSLLSYCGIRLTKNKKIEQDAAVLATVLTKLDNIIKTVEEIKQDFKIQEKMNFEFEKRLVKVEEQLRMKGL